jgi:PAS domain S-box-containing protein
VRSREVPDETARQLRLANEEFRAIYEQGLFAGRLDLEGKVIDGNHACIEGCGFTRAAVIGEPLWECGWWNLSPEIQAWVRKAVEQAIAGEPFRGASRYFWADGTEHFVDFACIPIKDADGRVVVVIATGMDITERVQGERSRRAYEEEHRRAETLASLHESEVRFRATFDNAAVGIAHVSSDLKWLRANQAFCRIIGWPINELLTKSLEDVSHPDDLEVDLAHVQQMRLGKIDNYDMEKRYRRKDGAIIWGKLTVSCVRTSDGPIDYFVAVVEDITARKRAEEELRKSEERFRSSILHSPVPTILFDDREQILAVSRSWLKAAGGVSAAELHRIEDWTIRAYGERSGEVLELIRGIIATEPEARSDELMIFTRGGDKRVWNFVTSGLGTQSDGRRLFVSVAQDVTDRRAYEARIQLLMREARHRTKNVLSLVQAIARQTATGDTQDFIGRFTERIRALAANQDLLVRHEWQRIDVKDLVQIQLGHFVDLIGTRINFDGPKLHLNAAAAQAVGLALHELATNASKYGALSTDAGRVDVSWQLDDDNFVMSWIEGNGPPVPPPERRGFGSTVTESMVKQTLGGEVQLDYAPSGLEWRLTCQAADALEQTQ